MKESVKMKVDFRGKFPVLKRLIIIIKQHASHLPLKLQ